jgi:hypothetical protein
MSWYEKSRKAAEKGAHVAVVLYGLRSVELLDGGNYQEDRAMGALSGVLQYAEGLKKPEDIAAVNELAKSRFPSLVEKMEIQEEQDRRRSTGKIK